MCLIPEIRFDLEKLCDFVQTIMARKDYCVVCVAEGGRGALPPRLLPTRAAGSVAGGCPACPNPSSA